MLSSCVDFIECISHLACSFEENTKEPLAGIILALEAEQQELNAKLTYRARHSK